MPEVGRQGGEVIIGDLWPCGCQRGKQRAFPDVRKPTRPTSAMVFSSRRHFHRFGFAARAWRNSAPAASGLQNARYRILPRPPCSMNLRLPRSMHVRNHRAVLDAVEYRTDGHFDNQLLAVFSRWRKLELPSPPVFGVIFAACSENPAACACFHRRTPQRFRRLPPSPPSGPPLGTYFSRWKGHAAVAAVAGLYLDFHAIHK